MARQPLQQPDPWGDHSFQENPISVDITGTQAVSGDADSVSRGITIQLLNTGVPGQFSGLFEITEQSQKQVVVRKTGSLICSQPTSMYFSEVEFELKSTGPNSVDVNYRIGFERLARLLRRTALGIILGLGLPVMLIVGIIIWTLVVNHQNPAVRWQVFQTLQILQVLWPPFLVMSFYDSGRRHARTFISNLLRQVDLLPATSTPAPRQ